MVFSPSMRQVFVRDLSLLCSIGVHQHEKNTRQRITINLNLSIEEDDPVIVNDMLDHVVCYETLVAEVRALVSREHVNLVETLAEKVAMVCLRDRRVREARVRVEKPDIIPDALSVGVEIVRNNPVP